MRVEGELLEAVFCSLTPEGKKVARELFDSLPEKVGRKMRELKKFNEVKLKGLLGCVYSKYPKESKYIEFCCITRKKAKFFL